MKRITITGGLCTGKTMLSDILSEEYNTEVFNSDKYVKNLYTKASIKSKISQLFPEVIDRDGEIDRALLANIIFEDKSKKEQLEAIIIPEVKNGLLEFQNQKKNEGRGLIIQEIPLLYEQNLESYTDIVIVTYCSKSVREKRALIDRQIKPKNYQNILNMQLNLVKKIYKADILVDTEGTKEYIRNQVKNIMSKLGLN